MSRNYKFHNKEGVYFVSFATVFQVDVFVRRMYFDCIVENLNICIEKKGMKIFCWCIIPSHLHLIFQSTIQKPEELLRDFNGACDDLNEAKNLGNAEATVFVNRDCGTK